MMLEATKCGKLKIMELLYRYGASIDPDIVGEIPACRITNLFS